MGEVKGEGGREGVSVGQPNRCELNQQSTLMLMLLCLFKLIIKDRAAPPPPPHARAAENLSLQ